MKIKTILIQMYINNFFEYNASNATIQSIYILKLQQLFIYGLEYCNSSWIDSLCITETNVDPKWPLGNATCGKRLSTFSVAFFIHFVLLLMKYDSKKGTLAPLFRGADAYENKRTIIVHLIVFLNTGRLLEGAIVFLKIFSSFVFSSKFYACLKNHAVIFPYEL